MKIMKILRGNRGFTIIELMIVVSIIGVLAGVAVPNFMLARDRAKIASGAILLGGIATACELYSIDEQNYPRGTPLLTAAQINNVLDMYITLSMESTVESSVEYLSADGNNNNDGGRFRISAILSDRRRTKELYLRDWENADGDILNGLYYNSNSPDYGGDWTPY